MNKEKTHRTKIIFSAIMIGSIIIGTSIIYSAGNNNASTIFIDKNNEKFTVEADEPITLTIITDKNCEECNTEEIKTLLKKQLGGPLAINELDYSSSEAKEILKKYNADYLPFLLLGEEVDQKENFVHLTHHIITKTQDRYLVDLEKMGTQVGKYLNLTYYEKDDPKAPKIIIVEKEKDLGEIKLSKGKVQISFTVKNEGESPLTFLGLNTSCGCTSGKIITENEESPVYQMAGHGETVKWRGELNAGEEAEIIVYYDPGVHPDLEGDVTREVEIKTNDPNNPSEILKINLTQSK